MKLFTVKKQFLTFVLFLITTSVLAFDGPNNVKMDPDDDKGPSNNDAITYISNPNFIWDAVYEADLYQWAITYTNGVPWVEGDAIQGGFTSNENITVNYYLDDGIYKFWVQARVGGNWSTWEPDNGLIIWIDTQPPSPPTTLTNPENPTFDVTPNVSWAGYSESGSGIYSFTISFVGSTNYTFYSSDNTLDDVDFDNEELEYGDWDWRARVTDWAGNLSNWSSYQSITVEEEVAPVCWRISPSNNTSVDIDEDILFEVGASDDNCDLDKVKWYKDDDYITTHDSGFSGCSDEDDWTTSFNTTGSHTIEAKVYDENLNNSSVIWNITVNSGTITIYVQDQTGAYKQGVHVKRYDNNWDYIDEDITDSDGEAGWNNIPLGTYNFEAYWPTPVIPGEYEFWGTESDVVLDTDGETLTETIQRFMPYTYAFYILDDNGNQKSDFNLGETVTMRYFVSNDFSSDFDVKIRAHADRNKDDNYDFTQLSAFHTIAAGSTGWIDFDFTPTQTGSYFIRPYKTITDAWGYEKITDTWPWPDANNPSFEVIEPLGNINITVHNVGGPVIENAKCNLYQNGDYTGNTLFTDANGEAYFQNIPVGTDYKILTYYDGNTPYPGEEFWGNTWSFSIAEGNNTPIDFYRYLPYVSIQNQVELRLGDENGELLNASSQVPVGSIIWMKIPVQNDDQTYNYEVRVSSMLDIDQSEPFVIPDYTSNVVTISDNGGTYDFIRTFTVNDVGQYEYALKVETKVDGYNWEKTDSWGWIEAFNAYEPLGNINITVHNVGGPVIENAKCNLYQNGDYTGNTLFTDANGEAYFQNIPVGTDYKILTYYDGNTPYPGEEFWGNTWSFSIAEGNNTPIDFYRYLPYVSIQNQVELRLGDENGELLNASSQVPVGSIIWMKIPVQNDDQTYNYEVRVSSMLDIDQSEPFVIPDYTSNVVTISDNGGTYDFIRTFTVNDVGQYEYALKVETKVDGYNWEKTDSWGWIEAFNVFIEQQDIFISHETKQIIDGFGVSGAWVAHNLQFLDPQVKINLLNNMFSSNGAHISILRNKIEVDGNGYDTEQEQLISDVIAINSDIKLLSVPWSPPLNFLREENNRKFFDRGVEDVNLDLYSDRFVDYLNTFNGLGINIKNISIQNEPDFPHDDAEELPNWDEYETCRWVDEDLKDFIPVLREKLNDNGYTDVKILVPAEMGWEHSTETIEYFINEEEENEINIIDIIGTHGYWGGGIGANNFNDEQDQYRLYLNQIAQNNNQRIWMTEWSEKETIWDGNGSMEENPDVFGIDNALFWAERIWRDIYIGGVSAWLYWWIYNPNDYSNDDYRANEGLAVKDKNWNILYPKRFYSFSHFSRFMQPNSQIIYVNNETINSLNVIAAKDIANDQIIINVINQNNYDIPIILNLDNSYNIISDYADYYRTSDTENIEHVDVIDINNTITILSKSVNTFLISVDLPDQDIEMQLYRISDIDGIPNTNNPGIIKSDFDIGEAIRLTFKIRNNGSEVPIQAVLNIKDSNGHWIYDSNIEGNNNTTALPNDGNWYYYSFDWIVPQDAPFGNYDFGGSVRNLSDFDVLYETTCSGPNTDFNCNWVLENQFHINGIDTDPPKIEVWRVYQTGDLHLRVVAKVTDNESGINPSTVKLIYRKYPGDFYTISHKISMMEYSNYPDFYEGSAPQWPWGAEFGNGDAIIFKIEAEDYAGNKYEYPKDLGYLGPNESDEEYGNDWCGRTFLWDNEHLGMENSFYYLNAPSGAISFRMDDNDVKISNNTAIWYSLNIIPSDLNYPIDPIWDVLLEPKSGYLPLNPGDWISDKSVTITDPTNEDYIRLNTDRKTGQAILRNTWDMILASVKPGIALLTNTDWDGIVKIVTAESHALEYSIMLSGGDYEGVAMKILNRLLEDDIKDLLRLKIEEALIEKGLPINGVAGKVYGAYEVLKGLQNRIKFLIDILRFPDDQETIELVKESPLLLDESTIPGSVLNQNTLKVYTGESANFNLVINIPNGNIQPYFKTYALINIYSPNGEKIETTRIEDYDFDLNGQLNVRFNGLANNEQGTSWNPMIFNNTIGINVQYDFSQSSTGYMYKSSFRPYYMELLLYQNGLPGINVNPFEPDGEILSGKIPFRLYDMIPPLKPQINEPSAGVNQNNFGFDVVVNEKDIDHYTVFRKLVGESEFSEVGVIYNSGKDKVYYNEYFEDPQFVVEYKINAIDISGNESELSDAFVIDVNTLPPSLFSLTIPQDEEVITTLLPYFEWEQSTDPDGTSIEYELIIANNPAFNNFIKVSNITTNSYQFDDSLNDNEIYYWKVKATDENGETRWSYNENWKFIINTTNDPPQNFNLISPINNETVNTINPSFKWENSLDPDPLDTVTYTLFIYDDNQNLLYEYTELSDSSYQIEDQLISNSIYYWKVKATDSNGEETWSNQTNWSFSIPPQPNNNPELVWTYEINYEQSGLYPNTGTDSSSFEFHIKYIDEDSDPPLSGYPKLHLFNNGNEIEDSPFEMNEYNNEPFNSGRIYSTIVSGLNSPSSYSYYFEAFDSVNAEANGEGTSLMQGPMIYNIELITPNGNEVWYTNQDKNITWNNIGDFQLVDLLYSIDNGNNWSTIINRLVSENNSYTWNVPDTPSSSVLVKIIGYFPGGVASDTCDAVFEIHEAINPPDPFSLISPYDVELTDLTPEFQWNESSDPDGSAITYALWYATNPQFSSKVEIGGLTNANYTPVNPLPDNATIYWKVKATDGDGQVTWSNETDWYFYTNVSNDAPTAFSLISPENETMEAPTQPEFTWGISVDPDPNDEITYTLYVGTDMNFTSGTFDEYSGISDNSFMLPAPLELQTYYYWKVKAMDNNGAETWCFADYWWFKTSDCLQFTPAEISTDQTVCFNSAPDPLSIDVYPTGGDGSFTYQWQSSVDNVEFYDIQGATGETFTPLPLTSTTYFRMVATSGVCGSSISNSVEITVYPEFIPGTIGNDQEICNGETPDPIVLVEMPEGGDGTYTYQWQLSLDDDVWNNIDGETATSLALNQLTDPVYLRCEVTSGSGCGTGYTNSISISVSPQPTLDTGIDGSDDVCENDSYAFSASAENYSSVLWTTAGDGSFDDAASLTAVYTPGSNDLTSGSVEITLTASPVAPCTDDVSDIVLLNIIYNPEADAGADHEICEDGSYTLEGSATDYSSISWSSSGDGTFDNANLLDATYSPGTTDIANGNVTLTLTAYPLSPCATVYTDDMILIVAPLPTVDAGTDGEVCENGNYQLAGAASDYSNVVWTSSGDGTFDDATSLTAVYTPGSNDLATGSVELTLTASPVAPCADNASDMVLLNIIYNPEADAGADDEICEDGSYTLDGSATDYSSISWSSSGDGTFDDVNLINATYTPGVTDIANGSVTLTITAYPLSPCATNYTDDMTLTVAPLPTADVGTDGNVCENGNYQLAGAATDYSNVVWSSSGDGSFDDANLLDATYSPGTTDIANGSVILTLTASPVSPCAESAEDNMVLSVDPLPAANAGDDDDLCESDTYALSGSAENYSSVLWTTAGDGSFDDATSLTAVYTPGNSDLTTGSVELTLTASPVAPCADNAADMVFLNIIYNPEADAGADDEICEDGNYTLEGTATDYSSISWSSSGDGTFDNANLLDATYSPGTTDIANGNVTLTLTAYPLSPCATAYTDNMVLTIAPLPTADAGIDGEVCENGNYQLAGAATDYSNVVWSSSGDGTFDDENLLDATYSPGTIDIANGSVTLTLTASPVSPCAESAEDNMVLSVDPLPTANAGDDDDLCESDTYALSGSAENYSSALWTTAGDGSFDDATSLTAVYTPGNNDLTTGSVELTLTASPVAPCADDASDIVLLNIIYNPEADAGADNEICEDGSYTLDGSASDYSSISWSSSGDGTFDDVNLINATYTPGTTDIANGSVTLTLTAYPLSPCATNYADDMVLTIVPLPTADAGTDGEVCENGNYQLAGVATDYNNIVWSSSGDGTFDDANLLDATYSPGTTDIANGNVTLTLTAYPLSPCATNYADDMTLTVAPLPTADAGTDGEVCENGSYQLAGVATDYSNIVWSSSGDGSFDDANLLDATYTPGTTDIANGSVILTLTASPVSPCAESAEDNMVLSVDPLPAANAGDDDDLCESDTYALSGSAENYSSVLWTTAGDGSFDDATSLTAVYTPGSNDLASGSVELTLTASPVAPCADDASDMVLLNIIYNPEADAGPDDAICVGDNYTLDGNATDYSSIKWATTGDGIFDDEHILNPTYFPGPEDITNGYANLVLTAYSMPPCSINYEDAMTLSIISLPTSDAGEDGDVCENGNYQLSGSATDYSSVTWTSVGDGSFDDPNSLTAVYTPGSNDISNGSVELVLTAYPIAPCADEAEDMMLLSVIGIPDIPDIPTGETSIVIYDQPVEENYETNPVENADEYVWSIYPQEAGEFENGINVSTDPYITILWSIDYDDGFAYVKVASRNICGLSLYSDSLEVQIDQIYQNISENQNNFSFTIHPNPTDGKFKVIARGLKKEDSNIQIINQEGKLVFEEKLTDINTTEDVRVFELTFQPRGVYYIRYTNGKAQAVKKIVKQ